MSDKPLRCRLITPEARVFDADVKYVNVPMWDGQRGFMKDAAAVVGKLGPGELNVEFLDRSQLGVVLEKGAEGRWFISGGFMQNVGNTLTILATGALQPDSLDEGAAKAELEKAIAKSSKNVLEMDRITEDRARARAKIAMARTKR